MENPLLVRDWRGRPYLVGHTARELTGRPRSWMFWLPWAAMIAIAPLQYGYAAATPVLLGRHDGSVLAVLLPLTVWIACQAVAAVPAIHLVRRGRLGVRPALAAGAVLSAAALLMVATATGTPALLAGYSLAGGVGGGLVYGVCTEVVARWYPERPARWVAYATGAYAYGAAPLAVVLGLAPHLLRPVFVVSAALALPLVGAAAWFVRLPPRHWWPHGVDPRAHALDRLILRRTPPAVRQFSMGQALRTGALSRLAAILACAGAVSLFDVVALAMAEVPGAPWVALALLVTLNGAGRACAVLASEVAGRRRVLGGTLAVLAAGQALLAAGFAAGSGPLVVAAAGLAGLGGGAFYPLVASLVREYFGEEHTAEIHGAVYSAKAVAGVLGTGLAALAWASWGLPAAFGVAAAVAALTAAAGFGLRVPGRPVTLPTPV
ncbi:MFS transporter [Sphaerisporangium album]|uniref:MFS transporter n=1 Tax=Sphaerisporangium album TaxID=509200 RepID=A0A367F4Y4_9ACTN|nr:MFS transporter [Sphaerisporangium album]RCG24989.1 MFS transporter [Sphaerisporangium album]